MHFPEQKGDAHGDSVEQQNEDREFNDVVEKELHRAQVYRKRNELGSVIFVIVLIFDDH